MSTVPVPSDSGNSPSSEDTLPSPPPSHDALYAVGLTNPGTQPTADTTLADLLLYALSPHGGPHPERAIILAVAADLETLCSFIDGPINVTLDMMARRLRVAVDLAERIRAGAEAVSAA